MVVAVFSESPPTRRSQTTESKHTLTRSDRGDHASAKATSVGIVYCACWAGPALPRSLVAVCSRASFCESHLARRLRFERRLVLGGGECALIDRRVRRRSCSSACVAHPSPRWARGGSSTLDEDLLSSGARGTGRGEGMAVCNWPTSQALWSQASWCDGKSDVALPPPWVDCRQCRARRHRLQSSKPSRCDSRWSNRETLVRKCPIESPRLARTMTSSNSMLVLRVGAWS